MAALPVSSVGGSIWTLREAGLQVHDEGGRAGGPWQEEGVGQSMAPASMARGLALPTHPARECVSLQQTLSHAC